MTAREATLQALIEYRRNNLRPDLALSRHTAGMPERETGLAMRLFNGVLQNAALCDWYAALFSTIELKKLEPRVLDILRLSIYQIVFLTKIPHSAAVNEGVLLAKKKANPRAAGYVNAVLRKVADAAASGKLPEVAGENGFQRLSIKYSHPERLVRDFCKTLGMEGCEAFLAANNDADIPVTVQVNTILTSAKEALSMLKADGVEAVRHERLDNCIELYGAGSIGRLPAYKKGYIYVQDAAARLSVMAAGPRPGDFVIDGCAAPGGKSFAAAIQMENNGRIEAFDVSPEKLRFITDGAARLGIGIITVHAKEVGGSYGASRGSSGEGNTHTGASRDSSGEGDDDFSGRADVVIADVPCSGFGAIRKKPEIRYKRESDIAGLPEVQKRILSGLSSYVKPGGTLLYSTCTVLRSENEDIVEWFLRENSEFSAESFSIPIFGTAPGGMVTLLPHIHGTDGFFICRMRRAGARKGSEINSQGQREKSSGDGACT